MTTLHLPPALTEGSRVALVTPLHVIASPELIDAASNLLTSWGLDPVVPTQTTLRDRQFGGTDAQRAEAHERRVSRPRHLRRVGASWGGTDAPGSCPCSTDRPFRRNPTWITGFSDITALHGWASGLGVASLHAPVALDDSYDERPGRRRVRQVWRTGKPLRTKAHAAWWAAHTHRHCLPCWARRPCRP